MSLRLELSDLPPRYRAQVEQKITKNGKKRHDPVKDAVRSAAVIGLDFDSQGEYEYYIGTAAPCASGTRSWRLWTVPPFGSNGARMKKHACVRIPGHSAVASMRFV